MKVVSSVKATAAVRHVTMNRVVFIPEILRTSIPLMWSKGIRLLNDVGRPLDSSAHQRPTPCVEVTKMQSDRRQRTVSPSGRLKT